MGSMRRNLVMLVALAFLTCFLPSMASPLLSRSDLAATVPTLNIAMPVNVSAANISMPYSMKQDSESAF